MKRNIKQTLFAPALLLLAATLGMAGCTNDDTFGRLPEGSIPLEVGEVTVAGMKTNTRAAIGENAATGYTGIRKSTFVNGDELALTLSNDGGTTNTTITATLTGGAWVLSDKTYVIPGTTTITAAYTAAEQTTGIKPDALEATTYTLTGQKVTFAMKHANAMIDITIPAGVTVTDITVTAHNGAADETLTTIAEDEADGTVHYRTIALPGTASNPGTVKSITAVINSVSYVATLATPLPVAANNKYPISLTFKENKLTATVGTAALDWGMGGITDVGLPAGYTRVIRTPEDLAQFAKDVNDDDTGTGARAAIAIQTADLDMSKLKPAAEAGTNPLTNSAYTYTATADNWVPIGQSAGKAFTGKYNGNGYSISNLTITTGTLSGLFGNLSGAAITGIHLRGYSANGPDAGGTLAANAEAGSVITLCSATGTLITGRSYHNSVGGFIGSIVSSAVTRCSADVDVTMNGEGYNELGGFIGTASTGSIVAGCSATTDIAWNSSSISVEKISGFISWIIDSAVFGCYYNGTMQDTDHAAFAMFNSDMGIAAGSSATSCYSTVEGSFFINAQAVITDCAYAHTNVSPPDFTITGVTGDVTPANAYGILTASNGALADVKTLHWSKEDGYTLTEVTRPWYATEIWKDNGTDAPTLDMTYEGFDGTYEGQPANLLEISGQTAYWVAPVDAETSISWNDMMAKINTVCPEGWKVPTKDEFKAMTGITVESSWVTTNYPAIAAAFPAVNRYWSSTEFDTSYAWILYVNDSSRSSFFGNGKTNSERVRCVRKK